MLTRSRGFSLVELMVAMVAGLLLVAAVSALFASVVRANKTALQVSRLNQEVQAITDMMARDIQRAGYDANAANNTLLSGAVSDFYFNAATDISSGCIVVSYDGRDQTDPSGDNGVVGDKEVAIYSYRSDKSIWMVELSAAVSTSVPSLSACQNGGQRLSTDNTIEITNLTFSLMAGSVSSGARTIRIAIDGRDKSSPSLTLSLQRDIKLRNDGY
ncbi:PilW family protein [Aeromonas schubertii]|uniref:PilW family protein n=1 Tax=Aeromonas schubertii TaxID=652 RepID=UPI0038B4F76C